MNNDEMKLLTLSDTSRASSGRMIKALFEIHENTKAALQGLEGRRFAVALKLIEDDESEKPVEKKQDRRTRLGGILCKEQLFQTFLKENWPEHWAEGEPQAAAAYALGRLCEIESRTDLATNKQAAAMFDAIMGRFEMWKRS